MPKQSDIPELTDEEEAEIQREIANDPDNPELTDEQMKQLRPAREALAPELYAALTRGRRSLDGNEGPAREEVTIPLDRAVLDHFRATGPEWPNRINEALREAIGL